MSTKLEIDLEALLETLGLKASPFPGYHPCPHTTPNAPEADEVDNEPGLSPEDRRLRRLERRDALQMAQLRNLAQVASKWSQDMGAFVEDWLKLINSLDSIVDGKVSAVDMYVKVDMLIDKYGFKRHVVKPEPPQPTRMQTFVNNAIEMLRQPEALAKLNEILRAAGYQVVSVPPPSPPAEAPSGPAHAP